MTDRDDFQAWVKTDAVRGGARPAQRRRGPAPGAVVPQRARERPGCVAQRHWAAGAGRTLHRTRRSFSDCTSYTFELQAYDVVGDMAYTAGLEHTSASVDGQPRSYTLRATQVYRREGGEWKVAHRHGDTVAE